MWHVHFFRWWQTRQTPTRSEAFQTPEGNDRWQIQKSETWQEHAVNPNAAFRSRLKGHDGCQIKTRERRNGLQALNRGSKI